VYFVATALLRERGAGPTVIVSPLLALMRNQVEAAARAGIKARAINSSNPEEWETIRAEVAAGTVDVLLVSPEPLTSPNPGGTGTCDSLLTSVDGCPRTS
jgi:ATP-dependent DNA helicase RecQ